MSAPDVQMIARRLTPAQRSTVVGLDDVDFYVLGCAADTARRLTRGGNRRPPLVEVKRGERGTTPRYRLTNLGVRVKAALAMPG